MEIKYCCCIFYVLSSFLNASLSFIVRGLQPLAFTKIAYSDQLFEVSWQPPTKDQEVENYTVFWCRSHNNRDRPYQVCNVHIFSTAYLTEWKYIFMLSLLSKCVFAHWCKPQFFVQKFSFHKMLVVFSPLEFFTSKLEFSD